MILNLCMWWLQQLLKFKQVDEPCDLEHVLDVVVDVAKHNLVALGLGLLEHVKQDAQSARGDILEFLAFKRDVFPVTLGDGLECLLGLMAAAVSREPTMVTRVISSSS